MTNHILGRTQSAAQEPRLQQYDDQSQLPDARGSDGQIVGLIYQYHCQRQLNIECPYTDASQHTTY
jgi:hypothetical protein